MKQKIGNQRNYTSRKSSSHTVGWSIPLMSGTLPVSFPEKLLLKEVGALCEGTGFKNELKLMCLKSEFCWNWKWKCNRVIILWWKVWFRGWSKWVNLKVTLNLSFELNNANFAASSLTLWRGLFWGMLGRFCNNVRAHMNSFSALQGFANHVFLVWFPPKWKIILGLLFLGRTR